MSEADDDDDDKPLDASEKRLNEALAQGNQPFAREAPLVAMLVALVCATGLMLAPLTRLLADKLALQLAQSGEVRLDGRPAALELLRVMLSEAVLPAVPVLMVFAVAGVLASVLQNPPRVIGSRIAPKFSHLSPLGGFKRIFGRAGLIEFARALAKLLIVGAALGSVLLAAHADIAATLLADPLAALSTLHSVSSSTIVTVLVASLAILGADLFWSRHAWAARLRMTHQQMKDEMKESDGDPHMKGKRLALQRQRMKRMMAEVPKASVIITNPTHVAVALRYDPDGAGVPQLVAKGRDLLAQRIKALAAEHAIPMVEDVPLARALERGVEVGQFIPREFFEAIAEIIHIISMRRPGEAGLVRRRRFSQL